MTSKEVKYQVQRQDYNRRKGKRFMVETFTDTETGFDNDQEFEADGLDLSKEYRIEVVARMTKDIKEKYNKDKTKIIKRRKECKNFPKLFVFEEGTRLWEVSKGYSGI